MAAERHDPAARAAHVPEQELDDRRGADHLDADRVLRPADRVDERRRPSRPELSQSVSRRRGTPRRCSRTPRRRTPACSARSGASGSGTRSAGAAASRPRPAARRASSPPPCPPWPDCSPCDRAAWKPSSRCPPRRARPCPRTARSSTSYLPFSGSQPEKRPSLSSVSGNSLVDDHRRVRVAHDVLVELALVLEDVVDDAAEEGDVAAGADADVLRRHRARAREARVDVDDLAPRSRASITHWKPTGWFSAMFEPMITMQSEFMRSCW